MQYSDFTRRESCRVIQKFLFWGVYSSLRDQLSQLTALPEFMICLHISTTAELEVGKQRVNRPRKQHLSVFVDHPVLLSLDWVSQIKSNLIKWKTQEMRLESICKTILSLFILFTYTSVHYLQYIKSRFQFSYFREPHKL